MSDEPITIAQWATGAMFSFAVLAYALQKYLKSWKATDAESSVITIMHRELERMAVQNTILAEELNKLQLQILELNKELHSLSIENQRLNTEVVRLTEEISRLHSLIKINNIKGVDDGIS